MKLAQDVERRNIFLQSSFILYLLSSLSETFAYGAAYIATVWLVTAIHGHLELIYLIILYLLFQILGSIVVTGFRAKTTLSIKTLSILQRLFSVLIFLAFVVSIYFSHPVPIAWVALMFAPYGFVGAAQAPLKSAMIRYVVSDKDLLAANATISFCSFFVRLLGLSFSGFLVHFVGYAETYFVVVAFLTLSAILLAFISISEEIKVVGKEVVFVKNFVAELKYLISHRAIFIAYAMQLAFYFVVMIEPVLLAPFTKNILHKHSHTYAIITVSMAFGSSVGYAIVNYLTKLFEVGKIILVALLVMAIGMVAFSFVREVHLAMLIYFCIGFALSAGGILLTCCQHVTEKKHQAQLQAIVIMLNSVLTILIYLLMALLIKYVPLPDFYILSACLVAVPFYLLFRHLPIFNRKLPEFGV